MKKIISFLNTDIKIINSYFLFTIVLIILVCVGYSSYALFSFTKTSTNVIEGTVGELKKSGVDTLIKLTNNQNNSGLYTITHPTDSTLQIGTNEFITEYRYRGASPKNYVTFNNEVWRIIGVFPTDDGTGKIENRIKIIRNESIGNYQWNSSKKSNENWNNWSIATLNKYFNTTYFETVIDKLKIATVKYYLGGYRTASIMKDVMYQYERKIKNTTSNEFYYGTNPNSWVGEIALMYASDYGYAASDECTNYMDRYHTCVSYNWLSYKVSDEWLLNQGSSSYVGGRAFYIYKQGYLEENNNNDVSSRLMAVRPTLYLKSNIKITGGDGTSSNPYTLGL